MKKYTLDDIKQSLDECGLNGDDALMLHSSLFNIGILQGCSVNKIPEMIFDFFKEFFGDGAFLCPLFNYDFPKSRFSNLRMQVPQIGNFSEYFASKDVFKSNHPMFSIGGVGKRASEFIDDKTQQNPFSTNSTYHKTYEKQAYTMLLGTDVMHFTYIVYLEYKFGIRYRYLKPFYGELVGQNGTLFKDDFYHFCLPLAEKVELDFFKVFNKALKKGLVFSKNIGSSMLYIVNNKTYGDFVLNELKKDEFALLKHPPKDFYTYDIKLEREVCMGGGNLSKYSNKRNLYKII